MTILIIIAILFFVMKSKSSNDVEINETPSDVSNNSESFSEVVTEIKTRSGLEIPIRHVEPLDYYNPTRSSSNIQLDSSVRGSINNS